MGLEQPRTKGQIDDAFPFPRYRPLYDGKSQRDIIYAIYKAFKDGVKNVLLSAPTGIGKSAINTTLCNLSDDAFYTTPQKSLRTQLQTDPALNSSFDVLKARRDYTCGVTGQDCKNCDINYSRRRSCREESDCTYWNSKQKAMDSHTAVLTFAYLIIDSKMPAKSGDTKTSFDDRELLVVDEAQNLADQIASLHAGIDITYDALPDRVYNGVSPMIPPDAETHEDIMPVMEEAQTLAEKYLEENRSKPDSPKRNMQIQRANEFLGKLDWFLRDASDKSPWVVDVSENARDRSFEMKVRPIYVSGYLRRHVWSRADKTILSTATLPFRNNPDRWCRELGLDGSETRKIEIGMPFPKENRPIHKGRIIGDMSSGGVNRHWDEIVRTIDEIVGEHKGEKGLIHSVSYPRAQKLQNSVNADKTPNLTGNLLRHKRRMDNDQMLLDWQNALEDVLVSPSMMEGVDLYDDRCRYQIMIKNPNPNIGDSRWNYILNEMNGWQSYYQQSINSLVQAAGRGVRHDKDKCDFYVLDSGFYKLLNQRDISPPRWFKEAVVE